MGAIKFPHASGNSMSVAAPATNPASDLELKLPATVGTANQVLKNSGTPGTLEFGAPSGTLLKTEQYNNNGRTNVPDDNWVGVGSQVITPTSATSKILVLVSMPFGLDSNNAEVTYVMASFRLTWNHSGISQTQLQHKRYSLQLPEDSGTDMIILGSCEMMFLHDHDTPNPITYEVEAKCSQSSSHLEVIAGNANTDNKTITLLEFGT